MLEVNISFLIHILFIYIGISFIKIFFDTMYDDVINFRKNKKIRQDAIEKELYSIASEKKRSEEEYQEEKEKLKKIVNETINLATIHNKNKKHEYSTIDDQDNTVPKQEIYNEKIKNSIKIIIDKIIKGGR